MKYFYKYTSPLRVKTRQLIGRLRSSGNSKILASVLVSSISVALVCGYLFNLESLPATADLHGHLFKIWYIHHCWEEGVVLPSWCPYWYQGYPVFEFYPPLTYLVAALPTAIFGLNLGVKLFIAACFFVSALGASYLLQVLDPQAYTASLISPIIYNLVFMHVYTAFYLGQLPHLLFVSILPWGLAFLEKALMNPNTKHGILSGFFFSLLFLSHPAQTLMFLIAVAPYIFIRCLWTLRNRHQSRQPYAKNIFVTLFFMCITVLSFTGWWLIPGYVNLHLVRGPTPPSTVEGFVFDIETFLKANTADTVPLWQGTDPASFYLGKTILCLTALSLIGLYNNAKALSLALLAICSFTLCFSNLSQYLPFANLTSDVVRERYFDFVYLSIAIIIGLFFGRIERLTKQHLTNGRSSRSLLRTKKRWLLSTLLLVSLAVWGVWTEHGRGLCGYGDFQYTPDEQEVFQIMEQDRNMSKVFVRNDYASVLGCFAAFRPALFEKIVENGWYGEGEIVQPYGPILEEGFERFWEYSLDEQLGEQYAKAGVKYCLIYKEYPFENTSTYLSDAEPLIQAFLNHSDFKLLYNSPILSLFENKRFNEISYCLNIPENAYQITINQFTTHTIKLTVNTTEDTYIVIAMRNYPGWTATINGTQKEIWWYRGYMAIPVLKGINEINVEYNPINKTYVAAFTAPLLPIIYFITKYRKGN